MKHVMARTVALALCAVMAGMSPARAAEEAPALERVPCTIELVDGRSVEGQLAVQFDMDDHLIVYSPRFATVRSFLKKHVHALTVDGQREQLNPKRALTEEDEELLGRITWPDAPPEKGRKPPYTTETWTPPKRLLVWARPGKSGRFGSPDNWLVNGSAAKALDATEVWSGPSWHRNRGVTTLNKGTDVLIPRATSDYQVRGRGEYLARHITVEPRATLNGKLKGAYGNLWVAPAGRIDGGGNAYLRGVKDTFFIHGERHAGGLPATPEAFAELMDASQHFARKWVVRKDDPAASVSLIGTFRSGDETHWLRGTTILEDDSVISVGPRCVQTVGLDARLIMRSGSILGKNGNQLYKNDMRIKGELLAGTPEEPITRDVYLGISIKDSKQSAANEHAKRFIDDAYVRGLTVAPGGRVRVHTADPAQARLHVTWHGSEPAGDDGSSGVRYDQIPAAERTINVNLLGDQVLNDVVFDHVGKGDIRLLNPRSRRQWQRVRFGQHTTADSEALFATLEPGEETQKQIAQWRKEAGGAEISGFYSGMTLYTKNPGTPTIETPAGHYLRGSAVTVRLSNETEGLEMRYTVDGKDPSPDATLYEAPFTVTEDVVVKAAGFKGGKQRGDTARARFRFVAPEDAQWSESADPGRTSEGLAYRYFEGEWKTVPDFRSLKPVKTGVTPGLDIEQATQRGDKFAVVFEGYIDIPSKGPYNVHLSTGKADACRVFLDGRLIVDNDIETLESVGFAGLAAGKHALRVEFVDGGWGEYVRLALRGLEEVQKRTVTADMLSH